MQKFSKIDTTNVEMCEKKIKFTKLIVTTSGMGSFSLNLVENFTQYHTRPCQVF